MTRTVVVVGYGMVAHRLVRRLRERDGAGEWRIVVLGEENRLAYDRVSPSSYVSGWDAAALTLPGADFADDPARFTSFVNAPGTPDPTISFRPERGQRVPVLTGVPEVSSR